MKHGLRFLVILAAVMTLMIMTASIALAHPEESSDGVDTARDHAGINPPLASNGALNESGDPVGGLVFNGSDADMGVWNPDTEEFEGAIGENAMVMQILHSPVCGPHAVDGRAGVRGENVRECGEPRAGPVHWRSRARGVALEADCS